MCSNLHTGSNNSSVCVCVFYVVSTWVWVKGVIVRVSNNGCVLQVSEMVEYLNPPTYIFLDVAQAGSIRGRVYIRVYRDTAESRQFARLCSGQQGPSFLNTCLTRVIDERTRIVCMWGGNSSVAERSLTYSSSVFDGEGIVIFKSCTEESGQFGIITSNAYECQMEHVIG